MSETDKTIEEMRAVQNSTEVPSFLHFRGKRTRTRDYREVYDNGGDPDTALFAQFGIDLGSKPVNACLVNLVLFIFSIAEGDRLVTDFAVQVLKDRLGKLSSKEKIGLLPDDDIKLLLESLPYGIYLNFAGKEATEIVEHRGATRSFWVRCINNHYTLRMCGEDAGGLSRVYKARMEQARLQQEEALRRELVEIISGLSPEERASNRV